MGKVSKVVKFYEPIIFDQDDRPQPIDKEFWRTLHRHLTDMPTAAREVQLHGVAYTGEARTAIAPAEKYFYVGRLRPPGDAPDNYRPGVGITGPVAMQSPTDRFSEPTIILPFGTQNYAAIMSPRHGFTRVETLSSWIAQAGLNLGSSGDRFELSPLVDHQVLDKLNRADGASKLYVRVPPDADIPSTGGGQLGDALRGAAQSAPPGSYVDLTWSFGHARATSSDRGILLRAARWLTGGAWTEKAEVSLQLPDAEDGFRTEVHALFKDRITLTARFEVDESEVPSEEQVLRSMLQTIQEFRRRV